MMKTLGPQSAKLVQAIHDRGMDLFTVADAADILGLDRKSASGLIRAAIGRGVATRIRRGSFLLVPFELGSDTVFVGNPHVVGHRLLAGRQHYLSHASAMVLHNMTTQPQFITWFSTVKPLRQYFEHGVEIRFVKAKPEHMFGITEMWATPHQKIPVSDLERTIIDGLHATSNVGGYSEIDKGAWLRRADVDPGKLVGYAIRLGVGALIRRVGFLMDSCDIGSPSDRDVLRSKLTATYSLLDPMLEKGGPFLSRWRLQVNLNQDELAADRRT